jgi:signal transduction histidine kinase
MSGLPSRLITPRLLRWPVVIGVAAVWWFSIALVGAANQVVQLGNPWHFALGVELAACASWVPLTAAIFWLSTRVRFGRARWGRALAIHLAGAAAVVGFRAVYIYTLDPWVHFYDAPPPFWLVLMHSVRNNLFQYFLVVGVSHAVVYAAEAVARSRNEAVLTAALRDAEQAALTAALQPHFLYNTLQSIAEMVHRDPEAADRMLVQLGAMLRRLLDDRRALVPLREELAYVADYLAIEQVRFGDRLAVRWDVDPDAGDVPVPAFSIQPLAENAIRHGLWPAGRPGTLAIVARRDGDRLAISVTDDGVGLSGASPPASGHGLRNVRARIAGLYAQGGELAIAARAGAGVEARVTLPCSGAPCAS